MAEVIDVVDDFVLSLDSLIRVGGVAPVESDEFDDYEKIAKALESAREKYGVNFQGNEAKLLFGKTANMLGSQCKLIFKALSTKARLFL